MSLLDDNFYNTKTAVVSWKLYELIIDLLENKLSLAFVKAFDDILNDMGALYIEGEVCHMSFEHPLKEFLFGLQVH